MRSHARAAVTWLLGALETLVGTWARWVSAALGVWLMAAPAVLGYGGAAGATHRLVGPVVAGVSFVAVWQHMRPLRWVNVPMGVLLLLTPWTLPFGPEATLNGLVVGLIVLTLGLVSGPADKRFGGGWGVLLGPSTADDPRRE